MTSPYRIALAAALQWHLDAGAEEALNEAPGLRGVALLEKPVIPGAEAADAHNPATLLQGVSELKEEALRRAKAAATLEELRAGLESFDGLSIKKTATQMVFSDGLPGASVMLIGEAPGGDEDRIGRPFVGASGQLLDRILKCINLDRNATNPDESLYISNILNWRPPGNRVPTPQEIEISLPFIERHIALAKPKILILCGGVSAKALLGSAESISRLRGKWQTYRPLIPGLNERTDSIPALATYHPSYLLRTPSQKKAVWHDMLILQEKLSG